MSIGPQLAESWEATTPKTWKFNLRKDVKFSDGTPMTSEDVVFSILRAQQRTSDFKEYISTITSVKATDAYTVEIQTREPNPILLNQLSNIFVMSKKGAKKISHWLHKIGMQDKKHFQQPIQWEQDHLKLL